MRRTLTIVLALALVAGVAPPVAAAPAVTLVARAGYDGVGKVGHWLPVEVEVANQGPDLEAEVQIEVRDAQGRGVYTRAPSIYTVAASLPRRSLKRFVFQVHFGSPSHRLIARLVQGGETVIEQEVPVRWTPAGELVCGVLTRQPSAFQAIEGVELAGPQRRARVAHLLPEDLPRQPQLLTTFDCLIFHNASTAALTAEQEAALSTWVRTGGLLILAGGTGSQKTLASLPPELLPVRPAGLVQLDRLDAFAEFVGTELEGGPWLLANAEVTDGVTIAQQGPVPLLVVGRRGSGAVAYLAFDPAGEPLRSWSGQEFVWRYLLAYAPAPAGVGAAVARPYAGWGRPPRAAMVDLAPLEPPSADWLTWPLLLLGLLLGPANYLLLRRLGRPGWAAWTTPTLLIAVAAWTFSGAAARREPDLALNTITLVRTPDPETAAFTRSYVAALARQTVAADLTSEPGALPASLYYPSPREGAVGQDWAFVVGQGDPPTVNGLQLPSGYLATFLVDGHRSVRGLQAQLRLLDDQVVGSVTNGLDRPITDAALILSGQVVRLGDLRPGEAHEVQIDLPNASPAGYGYPSGFASGLSPEERPQRKTRVAVRRDVLDAVFTSSAYATPIEFSGPTLIGWLEAPGLDLAPRGTPADRLDETLLVSSFPVALPAGKELEIPAALVAKKHLVGLAPGRPQFGSYTFAKGEGVLLEFNLPVGLDRFRLNDLLLHVQGQFSGLSAQVRPFVRPSALFHRVSLYNWRTTDWVDFDVPTGSSRVVDPDQFVAPTGEVRLRYSYRPDPDDAPERVTITRLDVTARGLAL